MKGILLFMAAATGLYFLTRGRTLQKLEFYPKNVKFDASKLVDTKAFFLVDIVNPTGTPVIINNVFANILINETIQLGRIEYVAKTIIKKTGTTTVGFPIKLFPYGIGATLALIIQGKPMICKITGFFNTSGVDVPFENIVPLIK